MGRIIAGSCKSQSGASVCERATQTPPRRPVRKWLDRVGRARRRLEAGARPAVARRHRFLETLERLAPEDVGVPASEMPLKALKLHARQKMTASVRSGSSS